MVRPQKVFKRDASLNICPAQIRYILEGRHNHLVDRIQLRMLRPYLGWSWPWPLTSICPISQTDPQHIQFKSNYHHLMFYDDKMVARVVVFKLIFDLW